jgi:hypothetical protein
MFFLLVFAFQIQLTIEALPAQLDGCVDRINSSEHKIAPPRRLADI